MSKTKYSDKAQDKIGKVMHEFKEGKLNLLPVKGLQTENRRLLLEFLKPKRRGLKYLKRKKIN